MPDVQPELEEAISDVLGGLAGQSAEFKRRLRKLIENATVSTLRDDEVQQVIDLATVDEGADE